MTFGIGVKLHSDVCVACGQPTDVRHCSRRSEPPPLLFWGQCSIDRESDRKQQINIYHYNETQDYFRPFQAVTILSCKKCHAERGKRITLYL